MDDRILIVPAVMLVAVVALIVMGKRQRAAEEKATAERKAQIDDGIARGVLHPDGSVVCVCCGAVATMPTPITGRPWFDQLPVLSGLNRLYGMPWRYSVSDAYALGARLCVNCYRMARETLERAHGEIRAAHSDFNAEQIDKLSVLEHGGLEHIVASRVKEIRVKVGYQTPVFLVGQTDTHQLPLTTSGQGES